MTKRTVTIVGTTAVLLTVVAAIVAYFVCPESFLAFYPLLTIILAGLAIATYLLGGIFYDTKTGTAFVAETTSPEPASVSSPIQVDSVVHDSGTGQKLVNDQASALREEWTKGMYARYAKRWETLFDEVDFPATKEQEREIASMAWEIASVTMDYLLTANDDPNAISRNKDTTDAVIKGEDIRRTELKEFFNDPSTVPHKVLAVNSLFSSLMDEGQPKDIVAFGYHIK